MINGSFFENIRIIQSVCECCGVLYQLDATLPDKTPIRIMKSNEGFHVSVYPFPSVPPPAIDGEDVIPEILHQWFG